MRKIPEIGGHFGFAGHFEFFRQIALPSDQNCSIYPYLQFGTTNETFASIWNEKQIIHKQGTPLV